MSLRRELSRALRNSEFTWRHLINRDATRAFRRDRPALRPAEASVVADLNRQGLARTTITDLLESTAPFAELVGSVREEQGRRAAQIAAAREAADQGLGGEKTFLVNLLGDTPELEPDSVYARFATQKSILRVVSAYFGMYPRLRHYNVWLNVPMRGAPHASQLWHRDREDYLILKLFVYLQDVTGGSGPLHYVPSTHRKGSIRRDAESFVEDGVHRSTDEQMSRVVAPSEWIQATGPKGTAVFADTRGYHKGGLVRETDRLMFVALYTSPASQSAELLKRSRQLPIPADRAQAFALAEPPRRRFSWLPF